MIVEVILHTIAVSATSSVATEVQSSIQAGAEQTHALVSPIQLPVFYGEVDVDGGWGT